jgi:hypothetical protein
MRPWLAAAAAVPLVTSSAALGQAPLIQPPVLETEHATADFKLPQTRDFTSNSPLKDGTLADEEVAPNAHLNLGLAPMRGRNIHSVREEQELVPTRNPGVSFVIKFAR